MNRQFQSEATEAGQQALVPGVAPISQRARLEHLMTGPMRARRPQRPPDIGLFDTAARDQLDMFGPGGRVVPQLPPEGG